MRLTGKPGLRLQHLEEVPRDGFALAILVGREVELVGVLERPAQAADDLRLLRRDHVLRLEVVLDVDREALAGQVADVPDAGHDGVVATEESADGVGLGLGFDDDEGLGHGTRFRLDDGATVAPHPYFRSDTRSPGVSNRPDRDSQNAPSNLSRWSWGEFPTSSTRRSSCSLRHHRAVPDHLRRVRPAVRLLPPRRLAALHRRPLRLDHKIDLNISVLLRRRLPRGGHRRPGRLRVRPQGRARRSSSARTRSSSSRSTSSRPTRSSRATARRRSCSPASSRSCGRSRRSSPGVGSMKYRTFLIYNLIGGFLWAVGVTSLGYFLGDQIGEDNIDKYLLPIIAVDHLRLGAPRGDRGDAPPAQGQGARAHRRGSRSGGRAPARGDRGLAYPASNR